MRWSRGGVVDRDAGSDSYSDAGLPAETTYFYRAFETGGTAISSNEVMVVY